MNLTALSTRLNEDTEVLGKRAAVNNDLSANSGRAVDDIQAYSGNILTRPDRNSLGLICPAVFDPRDSEAGSIDFTAKQLQGQPARRQTFDLERPIRFYACYHTSKE